MFPVPVSTSGTNILQNHLGESRALSSKTCRVLTVQGLPHRQIWSKEGGHGIPSYVLAPRSESPSNPLVPEPLSSARERSGPLRNTIYACKTTSVTGNHEDTLRQQQTTSHFPHVCPQGKNQNRTRIKTEPMYRSDLGQGPNPCKIRNHQGQGEPLSFWMLGDSLTKNQDQEGMTVCLDSAANS